MKNTVLIACRLTLVTLVLTGGVYPLAVTALAQGLFEHAARGSWVVDGGGQVVGSRLIGQAFALPGYFRGRPSAAGTQGYDAAQSGGSNLGPSAQALRTRIAQSQAMWSHANPRGGDVPADLLTTSASGLDPDISVAAAVYQVQRVADARKIASERIAALVNEVTVDRDLGFLGEPRVNVLLLNLALDRRFGRLP